MLENDCKKEIMCTGHFMLQFLHSVGREVVPSNPPELPQCGSSQHRAGIWKLFCSPDKPAMSPSASQWEETRCWTNVQAKRSYFLKTASLFRVSRDPSSNIFVAYRPLEPFSGERVRDWGLEKGLGERYSVLRKKTLFFFQKPLINGIICTQRVKLLFLKFRPSWLVQTGTIFCTWVIFH